MIPKTKILFISHDAQMFGATRSLLDLAEGLNTNGKFICKIILPSNGPIEDVLLQKQIGYDIINYSSSVTIAQYKNSAWARFKNNLKKYAAFRQYYKIYKPDIVYFNTSTSYFPLFFFFIWRVKTILHLREYGFEDYKLVHDWRGRMFKLAALCADVVLSNSYALKDYYIKKYNVSSEVIYNGVFCEKDFADKRALKPISENRDITIGVIGFINENKGQELVLDTFIELSKINTDIHLAFYGYGELEQKLNDKSIEANVNKLVRFEGFIKNSDQIYPALDIVIVSSKNEAFGRVAVEAMAYGIPVIGLANGGTIELLSNGRGLLFDGTKQDLSQKITLLIQDKKLKNEISLSAWEYARHNFSREVYVRNFISLAVMPKKII